MISARDPLILIKLIFKHHGIAISRFFLLLIYIVKIAFVILFGLLEWMFFLKRIHNTEINISPIFILGHYRSGTTYLHKLLISDDRFGYINYLDIYCPISTFLFEKMTRKLMQFLIKIFSIKNVFFHNMILQPDDPSEEDLYLISSCSKYSVSWGFVFPDSVEEYFKEFTSFENQEKMKKWKQAYLYCLKKITIRNNGKQLILKNPPNTARIKYLLQLFPDAKFIFLYRNPFTVYYSMQNLWKNVIEKYFSLQKISEDRRNEIIFSLYNAKMYQYEKEKNLIPKDNLVEIKYEDFERDPLKEIKRIYSNLNIPGLENSIYKLEQRIELEKKYSKFIYQYKKRTLDLIYAKWGYFIDKWNYTRPEGELKFEGQS